MKILLLFLLCALFSLVVFGQSETEENNSEVKVEEISLARDDGSDQPGEITTNFLTTDVPIHCLVSLSSSAAVTVKMNLVAVSAGGLKAGAVVLTVSYRTNGKQNRVRFKASPDTVWSAGRYRVDISIDGKAGGSQEFAIQKSAPETKTEKPPAPKTNSKPKAKPRGRKS